MKKVKNILFVFFGCTVIFLLIDRLFFNELNKIGVVQMDKLVYEFKGMKEATERYSLKMKSWSAHSDSLENQLNILYDQIRLDSISKDQNKLNSDIQRFMIFKQSYIQYTQSVQEKSQIDDREMTLGVINQINEYTKLYAEKHGFDVILCNNNQYQNVSFVEETIDITAEVLEFANKTYDGKK